MMNQFVFTFNSKRNPTQNLSKNPHKNAKNTAKTICKEHNPKLRPNKTYTEFTKRQYRGPNSFDNYPTQISQLTLNHINNPHKPTYLPHRCNTEAIQGLP